MASKTEMWFAFEHFDAAPIDHTFKRSPGLYFRSCNAEETPLPARPGRGRVHSNPPVQHESAWMFHHRCAPFNEQRRGPMLRCRSAEECSYDKVTASLACDLFKCTGYGARPVSKRGIGQFSPEAGTALTSKLVVGDLHSRGICDIDRNPKRGVGFERRACATTLGNEQEFSEEHYAELQSSLNKLTKRHTLQALPEFVHDLAGLGFECRRLQMSNFSSDMLENREGLPADYASLEGSKKFSPLRSQEKSAKAKRTTPKEQKTWLEEASSLNLNTQRLMAMSVRAPQGKIPKHAQSMLSKVLVTEAEEKKCDTESQAETCSTISCEMLAEAETCDEASSDEMSCQLPEAVVAKLDLDDLRKISDDSTCVNDSPCSTPSCIEEDRLDSPTSATSDSADGFWARRAAYLDRFARRSEC